MPGRGRGQTWRRIGWVLAGALAGLLCFHLVIMPRFVRHGSETEVPDLRGCSGQEASRALQAADLQIGSTSQAHDDEVAMGRVVRHAPRAGARVKRRRAVDLVISLGPTALRVPAVEGESPVHARFLLSQKGLIAGRSRTVRSAEVPADRIVAASPRPGTSLRGKAVVDLLTSAGPPTEYWLMPDMRGTAAEAAAGWLEALGMQVEQKSRSAGGSDRGRVLEQNPAAGHPIEEGGIVELVSGR